MDWFRELKEVLGNRIRLESEMEGMTSNVASSTEGEVRLPAGYGRSVVLDIEGLSPELVQLVRLLVEKNTESCKGQTGQWFQQLIDNRLQAEQLERESRRQQWNIRLPAVAACMELQGNESEDPLILLEEILSDRDGVVFAKSAVNRIWFYLPLLEGETTNELKALCEKVTDTLMAELYLTGRLGVSTPISNFQELSAAVKQAEVALKAGKAFRAGQSLHFYGNLGVAHLLYGVAPDAKAAYLGEVLPECERNSLSQDLRETIHTFAQRGQNMAETARALFIHRNTLLYRIDKIYEITGKDIRRFEDLAVLWLALALLNEQNAQ
ncbi:PucR family transcriptional regulator [Effusibacillus lacus]|uniref:PucR C-terminal helix-turn-helix domain-containing protein n=1 Tax=Effusibacillus lacus TaxID=1348429 RepID=A0A292YQN6_9BACL|nr:helix-turn-helix domain-containing protein [Effusibacillus lacus]TCS74188.1 PucR-like helix-turn-helix protein [Effusibacillus lacus]GAX90815.1 hypothetical protein EFBL_2457 [Effusibacillus lacus]